MGLSYDAYIKADKVQLNAAVSCKMQVKKRAKWGYRSDWIPNYSWGVNGNYIRIIGHDLQFKNAFNAQTYITYECLVNIDDIDGDVSIVSISD